MLFQGHLQERTRGPGSLTTGVHVPLAAQNVTLP